MYLDIILYLFKYRYRYLIINLHYQFLTTHFMQEFAKNQVK